MARLYVTAAVGLSVCVAVPASAQAFQHDASEGRVLNSRNGEYLENARFPVTGAAPETTAGPIDLHFAPTASP